MSALPEATRGADEFLPPTDAGAQVGTATASTTSAANLDLGITRGGAYVTFQARGGDVYLRFKATASTAATTSGNASNGFKLADGQSKDFWVPVGFRYCDHIASASCTLFWFKSSPNYNDR